jgi:serralysin
MLTGGLGTDTFVFASIGDSGVGAGHRDIITDFVSGTDKIDFSGIDANTNTVGNQAFQLIGSAGFSNVAGQLRFFSEAGSTLVEGDVNGDGVADFQLQLIGNHTFGTADLVL